MKTSKNDFNNLTRQQLIYIRKECDKSRLYFIRFWFKVLKNQKFTVAKHHEIIDEGLGEIENYSLQLLNINIPPRHGKTEMLIHFIARSIGMNPSSNWLYIAASDELRGQVSVGVRDIVQHPYFKIMYGVELKNDQNAKNLWRTNKGGGLKTATVFGQITGFGAGITRESHEERLINDILTFDGAIACDDLNKTDDSEAGNAISEKVVRVIANTILSRKNSSDTPIINIQQRTGENDATAFFMDFYKDSEKAKFIVLPVLYNGEPLWKEKFSMDDIENIKNHPKTAHVFLTQYMQDVTVSTQILFPLSQLKRFEGIEELSQYEIISTLSYADMADTGKDSTSMPVSKITSSKIFIIDAVHTDAKLTDAIPVMAQCIDENKIKSSRVEIDMGGTSLAESIENKVTYKNNSIQPVKAKGNKLSRIKSKAIFILNNFYFLSDEAIKRLPPEKQAHYRRFLTCLTSLKNDGSSKHDDAADAIEGLATMIQSEYGELFDV